MVYGQHDSQNGRVSATRIVNEHQSLKPVAPRQAALQDVQTEDQHPDPLATCGDRMPFVKYIAQQAAP